MRFAFVTTKSWFSGSTVGGAEKQVYYITTSLVNSNHTVDLYTMDTSKESCCEGVRVLPAWGLNGGIRVLRYFTHRLPHLRKMLVAGKYDLVYTRGFSNYSSGIVSILKPLETLSAIAIASDANLVWKKWKQSFPGRNKLLDPINLVQQIIFHRYTLKNADVVMIQNQAQSELAKKLSGTVVYAPSIFRPPANIWKQTEHYTDIVWIGGLRPEKGVEFLLPIIELLPDFWFTVVGRTDGDRQAALKRRFSSMKNVTYLEYANNEMILSILASAKLLLNTSPNEGFSNTFLEAWYAGIPVLSLFANPSGLLAGDAMGYCAGGDVTYLTSTARQVLGSCTYPASFREDARNYVLSNHNEKKVVSIFENLNQLSRRKQ